MKTNNLDAISASALAQPNLAADAISSSFPSLLLITDIAMAGAGVLAGGFTVAAVAINAAR